MLAADSGEPHRCPRPSSQAAGSGRRRRGGAGAGVVRGVFMVSCNARAAIGCFGSGWLECGLATFKRLPAHHPVLPWCWACLGSSVLRTSPEKGGWGLLRITCLIGSWRIAGSHRSIQLSFSSHSQNGLLPKRQQGQPPARQQGDQPRRCCCWWVAAPAGHPPSGRSQCRTTSVGRPNGVATELQQSGRPKRPPPPEAPGLPAGSRCGPPNGGAHR